MEDQQPEVQEDDSKDSEHAGQDVFELYGGLACMQRMNGVKKLIV